MPQSAVVMTPYDDEPSPLHDISELRARDVTVQKADGIDRKGMAWWQLNATGHYDVAVVGGL